MSSGEFLCVGGTPRRGSWSRTSLMLRHLGGRGKKWQQGRRIQPNLYGKGSILHVFCISSGSQVDLGPVRDGGTQLLCAALGGQSWGHRNTGPGQDSLSPGMWPAEPSGRTAGNCSWTWKTFPEDSKKYFGRLLRGFYTNQRDDEKAEFMTSFILISWLCF